jgi:ATP-dependent exoDNAse (exonuclease V) beta subunit
VVHALLAEAAHATPPWQPQALEARRAAVLELLRVHGVSERERGEAAGRTLAALKTTLGDARGRWILFGPHREAASELALTGLAGGKLRSVIIDRCFVDAEGTRWVIDYKTSRHEGGDLAGFLAQEMQRYAGQLATYLELAASLGPEPVRAALYFPLLGAFREFVPPPA